MSNNERLIVTVELTEQEYLFFRRHVDKLHKGNQLTSKNAFIEGLITICKSWDYWSDEKEKDRAQTPTETTPSIRCNSCGTELKIWTNSTGTFASCPDKICRGDD